jgi:hypothetical protein
MPAVVFSVVCLDWAKSRFPQFRLKVPKRTVSIALDPAVQLGDRDQPAPSTAHDAQLVHHVLLEEIDADAQGFGCLAF